MTAPRCRTPAWSRASTRCSRNCWPTAPTSGAGRKVSVFLASDDAPAKATAKALAESLGFATIDAGGLKNARYLEPLAGLNVYLGYGAGQGTRFAPTFIRKH